MPDNYAVRLSLSEAMLMRVTLEERLATYRADLESSRMYGNSPDATLLEKYEALEALINKL